MNSLDNILTGGEAVSDQVTTAAEENVTQTVTEAEGQTEQETEGQSTEGEGGNHQKMVPHEALHAEKQKVKRYTDEVADFRKSNEALQRQVAELLQRIPVPTQEKPQAPDFYENPEAATRHAVKPDIDRVSQALMANAQMIAGIKYGDDKVAEAEKAFSQAYQGGTIDPADAQRVLSAPNMYAAAAEWHKRQLAQAEIGPDPAAYKAKLEAEIREKVLAELQSGGGQQQGQTQPAPVRPTNLAGARNVGARSGPAWSGPQTLQDIFNR